MAERYYSVEIGEQTPEMVTEGGASTAGDAIELRVTYDETGMDKQKITLGVQAIIAYILQDNFPPT